jgi:hypothetical protein
LDLGHRRRNALKRTQFRPTTVKRRNQMPVLDILPECRKPDLCRFEHHFGCAQQA